MEWNDLDKKRIILISAFFSLFLVGTFLIFSTPSSIKVRYNLTVENDDGDIISFNMYEPIEKKGERKCIIIGHGIIVNKETLKSYAIEIATSGFIVVTCDFRGHGLSTGVSPLKFDKLKEDIEAIKEYLISRGSVDKDNFGYLGYSMGGAPGNKIVKDDNDFKCFIGIGTKLSLDYEDCLNRDLNILMILAKYDQAFDLKESKEDIADKLNIDEDDVHSNKLYGSFKDNNATMLFLDDNSDHFLTQYDEDFIRAARDWIISTFPDVEPVDENFYVNVRGWILLIQIIGGVGFFFLIIGPLSKLIVKRKSDERNPSEDKFEDLKKIMEDETIESLSFKTLIYSLAFGILGMLIILATIFIITPLSNAAFSLSFVFGNAFGIFILLLIKSKRSDKSIKEILMSPFKDNRENILRHVILGAILASIIYMILYLSIGLNYLGIIPSLIKIPWSLIFFAVTFLTFIVIGLLFQCVLQEKFEKGEKGFKNISKAALLNYGVAMCYTITYFLLICLLFGSFFFMQFLYIAVPMFLLFVFISAILYEKTGNILAGTIVVTVIYVLLTCTLTSYMFGLEFASVFSH